MDFRVFIGYASEDDDKAQYIHDCLARIVELIPYKAERYPIIGENFKERLQWHLQESFVMVVLLTENGKNSQWVNQEVGYAHALKTRPQRRYTNLPHIIPISQKQVELKGFITKDTIDILFLEDFADWQSIMATIIAQIRLCIPNGWKDGVLHYKVICPNCIDKEGFQYEWSQKLPSQEKWIKALQSNKYRWEHTCPKCKTTNSIDARTFLPLEQTR